MHVEQTQQPSTSPKQPFLDTNEAAAYLSLQRTTLEAWRCRGGGPRFVKLGRSVRYRSSDLDTWIESRTRSNTSEVRG